jgi:hypothetical protein
VFEVWQREQALGRLLARDFDFGIGDGLLPASPTGS